jgi:PTS HPr component phosphorylation site.
MTEFKILLNSVKKVHDFVDLSCKYPFDIDIISGKYTVNAKSIMGIFSVEIDAPLIVKADCDENNSFIKESDIYKVK